MKKIFYLLFLFFIIFSPVMAETSKEHIDNGIKYYDEKKYDKALEEFLTAIKLDSTYFCDGYYNIGRCYDNKGDSLKAIDYYKKSIEYASKDEERERAYFITGYSYFNNKKYEDATENFLLSLKYSAPDFYHYYYTGMSYEKQKKYGEALTYYGKSMEFSKLNKDLSLIHCRIGLCYYLQGNIDKSTEHFTLSDKYIPSPEVCYYLGLIYEKENKNDMAFDFYKKYVRLAPQGEYIQQVKEIIEKFGKNYNKYSDKDIDSGYEAYKNGDYPLALDMAQKEIFLNPNSLSGHYLLGLCYDYQNELDKAIEEYQTVMKLNPKFPQAYFHSGEIYADKRDYKKAIEYFNKSLDLFSSDDEKSRAMSDIGYCYLMLKDYASAITYYENSFSYNQKNYSCCYSLGVVYEKLLNYQKAIEYYKKYINSEPSGSNVYFAAANVENIENILKQNSPSPTQVSSGNIPVIEIIEPSLLLSQKNLTLEITSPGTKTITLSGLVMDNEEISKVTVNDQSVKLFIPAKKNLELVVSEKKYKYQFTADIALIVGENRINIKAFNVSNKMGEKNLSINYDPSKIVNVSSQKGEKWAVIIGIGKYQDPSINKLNYAVADAEAMYKFLTTRGGFSQDHVKIILNEQATLKNVKSSLGTFLSRKALKDDTVFIYYSGHGAPEPDPASTDGDGMSKYIVTYDADSKDLYSTAYPMKDIAEIFGRIEAKKIAFFIDACYSGSIGGRTFAKTGIRAGNISGGFLDAMANGEGRIIITASSANEVSLEETSLGHGVFTYYLLEGLDGRGDLDGDHMITLDELYGYLYDRVVKASKAFGGCQHPVKKGENTGIFVITTY